MSATEFERHLAVLALRGDLCRDCGLPKAACEAVGYFAEALRVLHHSRVSLRMSWQAFAAYLAIANELRPQAGRISCTTTWARRVP